MTDTGKKSISTLEEQSTSPLIEHTEINLKEKSRLREQRE